MGDYPLTEWNGFAPRECPCGDGCPFDVWNGACHPSCKCNGEVSTMFPFRGYTQPLRFTQESWLLDIAGVVAQRGTCGRLRVGALLVKDGHILSTGYNGAAAGEPHCQHLDDEPCNVSVHAEVNALIFAAKYGAATNGAQLYITHAPCYPCAGMLINAGVSYVRYRNNYRSTDGIVRLGMAGVLCDGGA